MPFLRAALLKNKSPELGNDEVEISQPAPDEIQEEQEQEPEPLAQLEQSEQSEPTPVSCDQEQKISEENFLPEETPEIPQASDSEFEPEPEPEAEDVAPAAAVEIEENIVEQNPEPADDADDLEQSEETEETPAEEAENNDQTEAPQESPEPVPEIEENLEEEPSTDTAPQDEAQSEETIETSPEPENEILEPEPVGEAEDEEAQEPAAAEDFELKYDFTSGERYVDKVSTKTEFDKMLDELADISKDLLSWEVEKFAKKYTGKFQGDFETPESDARKYEAFLGGYITNAAMILYDNGYTDAAIKQLDQAKNVLTARKRLEEETQAIKDRVVEEDAAVDLSDILGMFGDG